MKILLVHVFFTSKYANGANAIVYSMYRNFNSENEKMYIFATDEQPFLDENYPYLKYFPKSNRCDKNTLSGYLKYRLRTIYNPEAQKKMSLLLDEIKPDIVHIHSMWELSSSIIKPIKDRKIPIVYTSHDISRWCPALFFAGINYCNECTGLNLFPCILKNCANNWLYSIYFAVSKFVENILLKDKDISVYTVPTQTVKDYMIKSGVPENKIEVVSNFVSAELFKTEPDYSNKGYFLFAGGENEQKGLKTLLKAMKLLPREIALHIAGSGKYDESRQFIEDNSLSNIKILGQISKDELKDEYKNCISVIMPSECFESFGMVNIEAAAYGKPSIVSDAGGLKDVADNNLTGLVFKATDEVQLGKCILKYWEDNNLSVLHGKNARKKSIRDYSQNLYRQKINDIYAKLTDKNKC